MGLVKEFHSSILSSQLLAYFSQYGSIFFY